MLSDASGKVTIQGPVRALRWIGRTLNGYATFAAEYQLGISQVLADDGMVYPFSCDKNIIVSELPANEAFWYVVANDESEARWLRPVPSNLSSLGASVRITEANAIRETEEGETRITE